MNQEPAPQIHNIIEFKDLKLQHLFSILGDIYSREGHLSRIVVLTASDKTAKILSCTLNQHHVRVTPVCGKRKEKRKRRATNGFNGGRFQVLIVSQSGLDVETGEIYHFINFDMELPYPLNTRSVVRYRRHA